MIEEINSQCNTNFSLVEDAFIRRERIKVLNNLNLYSFDAKVTFLEYVGQSTVYTVEYFGHEVKYVVTNTTDKQLAIGDVVNLNIDPEDIMQFGAEI